MNQYNKFKTISLISLSILLGTFLSPLLTCGLRNNPLYIEADSTKPSKSMASAIELQDAFQEVFTKVSPSVVSIATEKTVNVSGGGHPFMNDPFFGDFFGQKQGGKPIKRKQTGLGSGIILNKDGYILTNHHVIKDMDKLTIKLKNGHSFESKLIGSDATMDIALLKIDAPSDQLTPAVLGNSSDLKVGSWAIAIGSPLGFEQSFTLGVVSAVQRGGIDSSGVGYIQTDAAINQGNSGGPLVNINGEVIGINRMIVSPSGGSVGIGFSIPINEAKNIVKELKDHGKIVRPWIGIGLDKLSEQDQTELGLKSSKGALVRQIIQDSPGDKAGLHILDVITKIDDEPVEKPEDIIQAVKKSKVGKRITLEIIRKNKKIKTSVTLEEKPNL
jgi:serine protease Do